MSTDGRVVAKVASVAVALTLAVAPAVAGQASPSCAGQDASAIAAVRAVAEGIIAADNRRDLAAVLAFYAPNATLLPPGEAPVTGHAAIRPRYEQLFQNFDPEIEGHLDDVCADGGLAVVRGRNLGRMTSRGGGASRELNDVYLMVLRREGDGRWRISELMWHAAR